MPGILPWCLTPIYDPVSAKHLASSRPFARSKDTFNPPLEEFLRFNGIMMYFGEVPSAIFVMAVIRLVHGCASLELVDLGIVVERCPVSLEAV